MAGLARTGAITLSLAINAGLLTLLALEDRNPAPRRIFASSPIYVDIEPVFFKAPVRRAAAPLTQAAAGRAAPPSLQSVAGLASAPIATPTSADAPAPAYDPRWTVRPSGSADAAWPSGASARGDGPDCRSGDARSWQDRQVCRGLAMAAAEPSAPMARSGDEDRTAAFAKEAAVKKRWRDYREGDGPYPGLRSLFGIN
nr:hypothetical protein [uncultured Brevundimonas sp.]